MGLTNIELIRRYQAGERVDQLAAEAEMSPSGLHQRLHRLGIPARTPVVSLDDDTIRTALTEHPSVNAAARALGVDRGRLAADAVRLGLRPPPPGVPADLADTYQRTGTVEAVAAHYNTAPGTAGRWLRSIGITTLKRGRRPRET